jgi:acetyl esterase/lipase
VEVYTKISASRSQPAHIIELERGAKGCWIGSANAEYVLLFFHGGGYIGAASRGHLKFQFDLVRRSRAAHVDLSIFSLAYTLAPEQTYPVQLGQAVSALRYLLEDQKRDPGTVLLGGDSAGGNLACGVLLHLARPHPDAAMVSRLVLKRKQQIRGAVLISPWIAFGTEGGSFERNLRTDYITVAALSQASSTFVGLGGRAKWDVYCHPSEASVDDWREVSRVVGQVLVWGGGGEILLDGIRAFAKILGQGFGGVVVGQEDLDVGERRMERVRYVEAPGMAHEEMIIDKTLQIGGRCQGDVEIEAWISSVLCVS